MLEKPPLFTPVHSSFFDNAAKCPDHLAVEFSQYRSYTYSDLSGISTSIFDRILSVKEKVGKSHWVAFLCDKNISAYASILGILKSGKGYLPLSTHYPVSRLQDMLSRSDSQLLIVDESCTEKIRALLPLLHTGLYVWIIDSEGNTSTFTDEFATQFPDTHFLPENGIEEKNDKERATIQDLTSTISGETPAYLLFTSGSTGRPKGVVVTHENVTSFLDSVTKKFRFTTNDRFSQNFDFTFDLSVFDVFVCFQVGACLCPPSSGDTILPSSYIARCNLSVWFSVPSMITSMASNKQLKSDAFNSLRYSLFCGEALTEKSARLWHSAAPSSILSNLYGPTEATIACTSFDWQLNDKGNKNDHNDIIGAIVPIGTPFENVQLKVLNQQLSPVNSGSVGELWIGGTQVAKCYLGDAKQTQQRFAYDDQLKCRFYRTGDRVFFDDSGILNFVGRVDHQVKVNGYRVELGEIEAALRILHHGHAVVVVKDSPQVARKRLIAFLETGKKEKQYAEKATILKQLRVTLPDYMIPSELFFVEQFPLNSNGKIDRAQFSSESDIAVL